jgi:hypothetical protein
MRAWTKADEEAFARSVFRRQWLIALERMGVRTVGELRAMSEEQLREIPNVGSKRWPISPRRSRTGRCAVMIRFGAWRCQQRGRSPSATASSCGAAARRTDRCDRAAVRDLA